MTKENQVHTSLARPSHKRLKQFRDERGLESLSHAIDTLITQVNTLERLVFAFKQIFDLTVEKEDHKWLIYGFNRKMSSVQLIELNELLVRYKNG